MSMAFAGSLVVGWRVNQVFGPKRQGNGMERGGLVRAEVLTIGRGWAIEPIQ
jgi:hypothetical protein